MGKAIIAGFISLYNFYQLCRFEAAHDEYNAIMVKALADRLAEVIFIIV